MLEDDLETLQVLISKFQQIELERAVCLCLTSLCSYWEVEQYVNRSKKGTYDILLLDRDDSKGGSFHNVDLSLFDKDKVISISSVPQYNSEAIAMGINRVVLKDYSNLPDFAEKVKQEILKII